MIRLNDQGSRMLPVFVVAFIFTGLELNYQFRLGMTETSKSYPTSLTLTPIRRKVNFVQLRWLFMRLLNESGRTTTWWEQPFLALDLGGFNPRPALPKANIRNPTYFTSDPYTRCKPNTNPSPIPYSNYGVSRVPSPNFNCILASILTLP